tara:strand:- start:251 stop:460 length:210 start_codon:yes stop_codon:yes gene_type:complete
MQLLLVPLITVIIIGASTLNSLTITFQRLTEQDPMLDKAIANDWMQQDVLQSYLDSMAMLIWRRSKPSR